jgi:hypothetical protein
LANTNHSWPSEKLPWPCRFLPSFC